MSDPLHLPWNASALEQRLQQVLSGVRVEVLARCDSTNTRLLERARGGTGIEPTLLVAEHQTHGRGRQGRSWVAAPGASLTFSLALALAPRDWSGLSLAVGLALAEALEPIEAIERRAAGGAITPRLMLKWPNDLWLVDEPAAGAGACERHHPQRLPGRKLGGILVETASVGTQRLCVVGVGLNVAPLDGPAGSDPVACLNELRAASSAPQVLAEVARPLLSALRDFEREGFAALAARYARRDLLRGRSVDALAGTQVRAGVAVGVEATGALLLRSGERLERIVSGEVSVRLQGGAP